MIMSLYKFYREEKDSALPELFTNLDASKAGSLNPEDFYTLVRLLPSESEREESEVDKLV